MPTFLAQLGTNPTLSISELTAALPDIRSKGVRSGFLKFESDAAIDQKFLNRLGGTILLARAVTEDDMELSDVPKLMAEELKAAKGKVSFALRFSGVPPKKAQDLYRSCKEALKARGISSRYVGSAREPAAAVQMFDEGLLDPVKGCELVILQDANGCTVARTVASQDVKAYTLRDIKKPVRDTTVGLLPPKLAQILLNFGEFLVTQSKGKSKKDAEDSKLIAQSFSVFDPFSGTGVIPMEAMLRGWNVVASDVAEKAVTGTKKNIDWAYKTFGIDKKKLTVSVTKHDAKKPFALATKPTMIVTEGTLGPALRYRPKLSEVASHQKIVDAVMGEFIKNVAETLPGVPVVMTLPVWYAEKKFVPLAKTWSAIEAAGFTPVLPPLTEPMLEGRFSLLYRRADQFVGREIVLLKPKK